MDTGTDDELLTRAARDADAFTAFYGRYERPVLAFFLRRTRDAEVAADLTAEVFAAVLLACARYQPGEAPAHAWLFGVAQHKLASSRRRGVVEDRARRQLRMAPIVLEDEDLERIGRCGGGRDVLGLLEGLPAGIVDGGMWIYSLSYGGGPVRLDVRKLRVTARLGSAGQVPLVFGEILITGSGFARRGCLDPVTGKVRATLPPVVVAADGDVIYVQGGHAGRDVLTRMPLDPRCH